MKKILYVFFSLVVLFTFTACKDEAYSINFNSNGGSEVVSIKTKGKEIIELPSNPTKEGHTFVNWYLDNDTFIDEFNINLFKNFKLESNINVYAKWEINQYTLTFNANGGSVVNNITKDYNSPLDQLPIPTKANETFAGWYYDLEFENEFDKIKMPAENLTLYAKWVLDEYVINFQVDGGENIEPLSVGYNQNILGLLPTTAIKENFIFMGWYANENFGQKLTFEKMPAMNLTLYASFIPDYYVLLSDDDFAGYNDGNFFYTGEEEYIIIPEYIKEQKVTSTVQMFSLTNSLKGVAFENHLNITNTSKMFENTLFEQLQLEYMYTHNVTNMSDMFRSSRASSLDLSSFDTSNVTTMSYMFSNAHASELNLSSFNTSNVTTMRGMFHNSHVLELNLSSFNTHNVTTMQNMFALSKATSLDLTSFDTSNVTNMSQMFNHSDALTIDLSSFDTNNVTNMREMFAYSKVLSLDLNNFGNDNVTTMEGMFRNSDATTINFGGFSTDNVTDMSYMFSQASASHINISNFNTENVISMESMFAMANATSINVSNLVNTNTTNMSYMFLSSKATSINFENFLTTNVQYMSSMFSNSSVLNLNLTSFDTSNVIYMSDMFSGSKANIIDLSSFDTANVTNMIRMFSNSKALVLDLSSFDISNVSYMTDIFKDSEAIVGFAKTEIEKDAFNIHKNIFVLKP